jgi:Protein of unknown function (DUF1592)
MSENPPLTDRFPLVDEYTLASRLSYFLWSSMPDAQLLRLVADRELRHHLVEQTNRMLADHKAEAFVRNFVGQWLQVRDIDAIQIDARQVLRREAPVDPEQERKRQRLDELRAKEETSRTPEEKKELDELRGSLFGRFNRPPRAELNGDLRRSLRLETEKTFEYVLALLVDSRQDGAMPCRRSGDPAYTVKAGRLVGRAAELDEAIRQLSGSGAANIGADILE